MLPILQSTSANTSYRPTRLTDSNASMSSHAFALIPFTLLASTFVADAQAVDYRTADAPALIFTGQTDAPRVVAADNPLQFTGQVTAVVSADTDTLRFTGQPPTTTRIDAVQLFAAVPQAYSGVFKPNEDPRFLMDTQDWDQIPYHMTGSFSGEIWVPEGARVTLAGDPANSAPIRIDNFLALEIDPFPPLIIGAAADVRYRGQLLEQLGDDSYSFPADSIDLTPFFATGATTRVTAHAMDYGGSGHVSDVYLIIESEVEVQTQQDGDDEN